MATTGQPTPAVTPSGASPPAPSHQSQPPRRVLACVLCQQRKVRCERKFPCSGCRKSGVQCVPAESLGPRQRKPRFPERALLERVRQYEDLLRQHNVKFDPMYKGAAHESPGSSHDPKDTAESDDERSTLGTAGTPQSVSEIKYDPVL